MLMCECVKFYKSYILLLIQSVWCSGCNILVKAEFLNPGGSVKDRAALYLIKDAQEKNLISPGGTVVEGTAGNTGIGLAHICNALGYKCVIYMPNTQSKVMITCHICSFAKNICLSERLRMHCLSKTWCNSCTSTVC